MNKIYLAMEVLAAFIILILIYANIYEVRQRSPKRQMFTKLLITNEIVVVADAISWIDLGWEKKPAILSVLIAITYTVPIIIQMIFSLYLYEHISLKTRISKKPFYFMINYSVVECILILVLCVSGRLFYVENGIYHAGTLEYVYYLLELFSMIVLISTIVLGCKKMEKHDLIAALTFCFVPLIAAAIIVVTGLNLEVTLMSVSMLLMYVMLQAESESILLGRAKLDELTGLYNRRAYEEELLQAEERDELNLVYASIDVNGLRVINDTLGHAAGDELLCGVAGCLRNIFIKYGKVFRTGGDEFVSIFVADENKFEELKEELEKETEQWKGNMVDSLSISVGYARKMELPDKSLIEIASIADKRMYEAKNSFYL